MTESDLERAVGRLEGKIESGFKDLGNRMDRMIDAIYGSEGIEPRLREVEGDVREIKAKAGMIAAIVSFVIGIGMWLLKLFNGR
ncbi:MAG: hypothetical protein A2Y38_02465 [Spirochaetes bacterium GWB1_59_5]|nr:MAG: hypothetical protein A2Y38_02465 [Spirochaetes bacterium GWB1_59_5]